MNFSKEKLLRIFVGEGEKINGKPLYEEIVLRAREMKLSGATVIKGILGFGADSHLHSAKILRLSEDLPIIIEIVDNDENIERFIPYLDEMINEGIITIEDIKIKRYGHKNKK